MRKAAIILTMAVLAGGVIVNLDDSRLPRALNIGPGQAFGADENIQVSMPKEAIGFNGTLLGQVVKPVAKEGWFTMKMVKVISYSAANKTKVTVDALTAAWKDQYDWCAPAQKIPPCPQFKVGDMVIFVGAQVEAHLRYTKVTKVEGAKPGDDPPAPKPPAAKEKPPVPVTPTRPTPTTAPAAPTASGATSQPTQEPEKQAGDELKFAQLYVDSGMKAKAREKLQALIKAYPDTAGAKEAKTKLTALGD